MRKLLVGSFLALIVTVTASQSSNVSTTAAWQEPGPAIIKYDSWQEPGPA